MASKKKASSLPLPPPPAPPPAPPYIPPPPPPAPPVIRRVGLPSREAISNNPELLEILLYAIREKESQHRLDVENNPKSKAEGRMQVIRPLFDMSNKEGLPPGYGIPVMKRGADATEVEAYGRMLFERYISMYGNVRDALVAYNFGPAGTNAWIQGGRKMSDLPEETRLYLPKITRIFERELAKPPEARMEHGRTISLPLSQITVPSKPPKPAPPAPPEKLDPSKQGMTLKAERDLARFHDEPGLVERYAKADATMAAEQALEDRGPRPANRAEAPEKPDEPAPSTGALAFLATTRARRRAFWSRRVASFAHRGPRSRSRRRWRSLRPWRRFRSRTAARSTWRRLRRAAAARPRSSGAVSGAWRTRRGGCSRRTVRRTWRVRSLARA